MRNGELLFMQNPKQNIRQLGHVFLIRISKSTFPRKVDYLQTTWLTPHRQKFVKCYTDLVTHYGNVVTSRVEGGHTVLKFKLGISTGDLLTVVTNIDSLLRNQHQEFVIALGEAKNNTPTILKGAYIEI